jgi:hypothetical protein
LKKIIENAVKKVKIGKTKKCQTLKIDVFHGSFECYLFYLLNH